MAAKTRPKEAETHRISTESALAGILALLADEREARVKDEETAVKTEILLSDAGLSFKDIAAVTGKKADTVRVSIYRGKGK
jgi:DNA-directed RNA polymerase specialized sigma24 family protein